MKRRVTEKEKKDMNSFELRIFQAFHIVFK